MSRVIFTSVLFLGSFVTFPGVLSMFILRAQRKRVKMKMDPFLSTLFLIRLERRWNDGFLNHKKPLKTRCTLVSNVGATRYFLSRNRSGLLRKERMYSTIVGIATINGEMDGIDDPANVLSVYPWVVRWLDPTNDFDYTKSFRPFKIW